MSANWKERPKIGIGARFLFRSPEGANERYILSYSGNGTAVLINLSTGWRKEYPVAVRRYDNLTPEEVRQVAGGGLQFMTVITKDNQTFSLQDWLDWKPEPDPGDQIVKPGQRWRWSWGKEGHTADGLVVAIDNRLYVVDPKTGTCLARSHIDGLALPARNVFLSPRDWTLLRYRVA